MKDLLLDIQTDLEQLHTLVKSGTYKNEDLLCSFDEIILKIEDKVKEEEKVYIVYGYQNGKYSYDEDKKVLIDVYKSKSEAERFVEEGKHNLSAIYDDLDIEEEYIVE